MREIKFRVWDTINKEWDTSDTATIDLDGTILVDGGSCCYLDGSLILCQFTGLKDKNGVEIWEGDILLSTNDMYPDGFKSKWAAKHAVMYDPDIATFGMSDDGYLPLSMTFDQDYRGGEGKTIFKVIGNIHENPELLETP